MRKSVFVSAGILCLLIVSGVLLSCSQPSVLPEESTDGLSFSPESGFYEDEILVTIASPFAGNVIRYTLDGSDPDENSELYAGPVEIPAWDEEVELKAAVFNDGSRGSKVQSKKYVVSPKRKVATPKFNPRKGTYEEPIDVTISSKTKGAVIRYTVDGSKPGPDSAIYRDPIRLGPGTDTLIKAVAMKEGMKNSSFAIGRYVVKQKAIPPERGILFSTNRDRMTHPELRPDLFPEGYQTVRELYSMTADGRNPTRLTTAIFNDDYYHFMVYRGNADWNPDGTRILYAYTTDENDTRETLYIMNADGSDRISLGQRGELDNPRWSPDGKKITYFNYVVYSFPGANSYGIFTMNTDGTSLTNIRGEEGATGSLYSPSWSPDSRKIAYVENSRIWIMNADGTGAAEIPGQSAEVRDVDWHPVLNKLAYTVYEDGQGDVYVMNTDGTGVVNLTNDPAWDSDPNWSPDGTQIAFSTRRDGNAEIYIMNANGSNPRNLTNHPADDLFPVW